MAFVDAAEIGAELVEEADIFAGVPPGDGIKFSAHGRMARLGNQQMNVLADDHVTEELEVVLAPHLAQRPDKRVSRSRRTKQWQPPVCN